MPKAVKQYISFTLADQGYVLPLELTASFAHYENILPLPQADSAVLGLTYQNGHLITVLSGEKILSRQSKDKSELYLLFKRKDEFFALTVSEGGQTIKSSQIFRDNKAKIFKNYIKYNKNKFYILDPEKFFEQLAL